MPLPRLPISLSSTVMHILQAGKPGSLNQVDAHSPLPWTHQTGHMSYPASLSLLCVSSPFLQLLFLQLLQKLLPHDQSLPTYQQASFQSKVLDWTLDWKPCIQSCSVGSLCAGQITTSSGKCPNLMKSSPALRSPLLSHTDTYRVYLTQWCTVT